MQFIWLYIASEAAHDELRYSIRSVTQNFCGDVTPIVVGDKPNWYTGRHIEVQQLHAAETTQLIPYRDSLNKLHRMLTAADIDDTFVIMMDDHYFVKPVTLAQLNVPRVNQKLQIFNRHDKWYKIIRRTLQTLDMRGYSTHMYESHLMHVFEKDKLLWLFTKFNLHNVTLLRDSLYGNVFRDYPKHHGDFISVMSNSPSNTESVTSCIGDSTVFNHASHNYNDTLREWLNNKFPVPSAAESCN